MPILPSVSAAEPEAAWDSIEEIQEALAQVRRQKLQLDQRERQLLRALAVGARLRIQEMVDAGGVAASELEGMVRRAVNSSAGTAREAAGTQDLADAADRVRKAPLRFRHPNDPGLVWSGRGKTPRWVLELQAQGQLDRARVLPEED